MSYLDAGYNKYMKRTLVEEDELANRLFETDSETVVPPSSIDTASIKEISLGKLRGGSLVIGGENNVLGEISIKDASGKEIAVIDNRGLVNL